jgi:omega-amidase
VRDFTIAVIQNRTIHDRKRNVENALGLVNKATDKGAELVMLGEIFLYPYELSQLAAIAEANDETLNRLAQAAKAKGIFLCTGSIPVLDNGKMYNRAYLLGPDGSVLLTHDKCHLFDVRLRGLVTEESAVFTPGDGARVADTALGKIGMLICYDIRFPEIARKLSLAGAEIILVPAAFNTKTGPAHWHVLFRSRAVENQVFVAAASPARNNQAGYRAYGHSLVVDPWGTIAAEAGTGQAIVYARLSAAVLEETRARLPLLKHRRPEIY